MRGSVAKMRPVDATPASQGPASRRLTHPARCPAPAPRRGARASRRGRREEVGRRGWGGRRRAVRSGARGTSRRPIHGSRLTAPIRYLVSAHASRKPQAAMACSLRIAATPPEAPKRGLAAGPRASRVARGHGTAQKAPRRDGERNTKGGVEWQQSRREEKPRLGATRATRRNFPPRD